MPAADPGPLDALVIGAGPAGLMAAEALAAGGRRVTVAEAMPTPGRKFLMAGKSGLNLTKDEPEDHFAAQYAPGWIAPMVADFGPPRVKDWARHLGIGVFTGSSGRVFPIGMKASPLLRAWLARLGSSGVTLRAGWRWSGWEGDALCFQTPAGIALLRPQVTVLALGGASWARLGSDAAWVSWVRIRGVTVTTFRPANMGFAVNWSPHMTRYFGQPVKGITLIAGPHRVRAEFVLSHRGIEGGGVYAVSAAVRDGAPLSLDLFPDLTEAAVTARLSRAGPGESLSNRLRKAGLDPVRAALVQEWGRPLPTGTALATLLKSLPVRHSGPRPIDEAISVAGGIARDGLTDALELCACPGMFACGEMLDWEAPTGGYLLTGCLATGLWAGRAAAAYRA